MSERAIWGNIQIVRCIYHLATPITVMQCDLSVLYLVHTQFSLPRHEHLSHQCRL